MRIMLCQFSYGLRDAPNNLSGEKTNFLLILFFFLKINFYIIKLKVLLFLKELFLCTKSVILLYYPLSFYPPM